MALVPKIITNKSVVSGGFKTASIMQGVTTKAAKMGKVTVESSFKYVGAGSKFTLSGGYTSPLVALSKPMNVVKKIVR